MILDGILACYDSRLIESEKRCERVLRETYARDNDGKKEQEKQKKEEEGGGRGDGRCNEMHTPGSNCDGTDATLRVLRHCFRDVPASFLEVALDSRTLSAADRVARRSGGETRRWTTRTAFT